MRLLTVSHFFESHGGGIERVAGHLCRSLGALGHECEWAASAADASPSDPAVRAIALPCVDLAERLTGLPMPLPGPRAIAALWQAIGRADAVIVHDALYGTSIAALIFARMRRKPVILIQHIAAIEFSSTGMRALMALANRLLTRPMLAAAGQVIFISETVRQAFADARMRRSPRLLFNGVDGRTFRRGARDRTRFGLPEAGLVAAFVGRFVEKKGLAVLRQLAAFRTDITFVVVGSGPMDPAQWKLPNVRLAGQLQPADLAALYRSVDCLLLPSVGEGYPLVIQEAMACGLPAICGAESARADPAAARWLRGVEIDLRDAESSAARASAALDRALPDASEREAMAAYAAAAYSWPRMAAEIAVLAADLSSAR